MQGRQLLLLLLAIGLLAPVALSAQTFQGVSPVRGVLLVPQLHCEIIYDVAGAQRCDVFGPVTNANELRITMTGAAAHVFVLVDDISGFPTRQMVVADCNGGCVKNFQITTSPQVALYIYTSGNQGATISVTIATGVSAVLG